MKKLILALMLVCLPISFVVVETGCTTSQQVVAAKTIDGVAIAVDKAYAAFQDEVYAGRVSAEDAQKAAALRAKYQAGMNLAIAAAQGNLNAPLPDTVWQLAAELFGFIKPLTHK